MEKQKVMGYMFSRCSRSYKRAINQELEKYDLTTVQCGVIRTLKYGGKLTQAEIADLYASDRATIGNVIQKLMDKGFVEKELGEKDKRSYVVSLTTKAIKVADEIEAISNQIETRALSGLSKEEIEMFYKVLGQIITNLEEK